MNVDVNIFLIWLLSCIAIGLLCFVILDFCEGRWSTLTTCGFFMMIILFICVGILAIDTESKMPIVRESEYDELVDRLSQNPFDKETLLEVVDMNCQIDTCNIVGDGDYYGLTPIDYKEIQKEYLFENYTNEIKEKQENNLNENNGDINITIDKELITYVLETFFEGFAE